MKAIVHTKYGAPDELQLLEVKEPVPGDNEVLIKIHATTVTTTDCNARNFTFVPKSFMFFARLMFGFKKPKINILGIDLAGEIEAIGKDVKLFKKGDQVFGSPGTKFGGQAEYVCVPENGALAIKPSDLSWEKAAAISLAGNTAFSDHRAFDQQIEYFSKDYKVITVDLIGHGFSKANKSNNKIDASSVHIKKILESEGHDRVDLVGVSMGSLIAQYFALQYPDKVKSLYSGTTSK
jgi:hypothetical protein